MNVTVKSLEELVQDLPPSLQMEVRDFVEFLLSKRENPTHGRLRQDWAEVLKVAQPEYTAVQLQHLALEWRAE